MTVNMAKQLHERALMRHQICKQCENYKPTTDQCSLCGCFMRAKVWISRATCPADKWK